MMMLLMLLSFAAVIQSGHGLASPDVSTSTSNNKPHILSVGLAAVDFVATVDSETGFPKPDDKIRSTSLVVEGGGNAANTACAIGRSMRDFCDVSILTAVGDDANGQTIVDGLKSMNVHVDSTIDHYEGSSPFTYILSTEIDGDNTRTCIHQPSTGDLSIDFVNKNIVPQLQDFTAAHFDVRYPKAAVKLASKLVAANIPYSVDVERPREGLDDLLQRATVVICNSDYCDTVLGAAEKDDQDDDDDTDTVQQRLRKVMKKKAPKAQLAVQTLGGKGSCLIWMDANTDDDNTEEQEEEGILLKDKKDPNAPVVTLKKDGSMFCSAFKGCKVVDTTGAGDSFQGGFIAALWAYVYNSSQQKKKNDSSDESPVQVPTNAKVLGHALRIATRIAAKKVEKPGARRGLPDGRKDTFIQSEMKAMMSLELKQPSDSSVRPASIVANY